MTTPKRTRLAEPERRLQLLGAAAEVFAASGFRGTTTARLAKAAGVAETILYRHFGSKDALYVATVRHVWTGVRAEVDAAVESTPDPAQRWAVVGRTMLGAAVRKSAVGALWLQAVSEPAGVEVVDVFLRELLVEVHGELRTALEVSQAAGGLADGLDLDAEAWRIISTALLFAVTRRLGGVADTALDAVLDSQRRGLGAAAR